MIEKIPVTEVRVQDFTEADVDIELVEKRAWAETVKIIKGNRAHGRTPDEIFKDCRQGQIPEVYLITHKGFTDDTRDFMDLFAHLGETVDIKSSRISMMPRVHEILKDMKSRSKWAENVADYIMCFDVFANGTYHHVGTFKVKK